MSTADALSPSERVLRARAASLRSWALTEDAVKRTQPGRDAAFARFLDEVDPEHRLSVQERERRARQLQRARMSELARRSVRARRLKSTNATSAAPPEGGAVIDETTEESRDRTSR